MQLVVKASPQQKEAFLAKGVADGIWVDFVEKGGESKTGANAYFDLCFEEEGAAFAHITNAPVFINAVIDTTSFLPANAVRINAWSGFLEANAVEIAAGEQQIETAGQLLNRLGWKYQVAPDTPGMIAPRVIAMIINEAYFGWGEGLSSKKDIDTAMKLGTNYPFGPFEWAEKIGLEKIGALLQALSVLDSRYTPAPALLEELKS